VSESGKDTMGMAFCFIRGIEIAPICSIRWRSMGLTWLGTGL
jgi:hypothetical protein